MRARKIFYISVIVLFCGSGCGLLPSMLGGPESPRPKEYQVTAAKEIATENVEKIMEGQLGKQEHIAKVTVAAILALSGENNNKIEEDYLNDKDEGEVESSRDVPVAKPRIKVNVSKHVAEAITNTVANGVDALVIADGSAKLLSELSGKANKSISEMSAVEYLAYAGTQMAVATQNQQKLYSGIKTGIEWTSSNIALAGGGGSIATALLAFGISAYRKMRRKDRLLKSTGRVIDSYSAAYPEAGKTLKTSLAKATAAPAKVEFGVP